LGWETASYFAQDATANAVNATASTILVMRI
jgi:hypothetical protein